VFVASADVLHKGHGSNLLIGNYIRYITKNRLMLIFKDLPFSILVRHFHHLLIGQLALFIQYRRPLDSILGYLYFLRQIPHVLHERRRILAARVLSNKEIDGIIASSPESVRLTRWMPRGKQKGNT
jgi:hypothetical protein